MLQTIEDWFKPSEFPVIPNSFEIENERDKLIIEVKDNQISFHNPDFSGWCIEGDSEDLARLREYLAENIVMDRE